MSNKTIFILLFSLLGGTVCAQELEYKMEVGAGLGLITYYGDFNNKMTKNMQPLGNLIARWNLNPRMAIKANLSVGKIKGNSGDVTTYYPIEYTSFKNTLYDICCQYEYNFWAYGTKGYKGSHAITPYMTLGAGFTYAKGDNDAFTINLPIGIGVKYKCAPRINVGAEWAMHFSLSDKLDGVKDPYGIKSSGMFKNTDCYSVFQIFLTYDILPKYRKCNN